jgi:hypothetical protein
MRACWKGDVWGLAWHLNANSAEEGSRKGRWNTYYINSVGQILQERVFIVSRIYVCICICICMQRITGWPSVLLSTVVLARADDLAHERVAKQGNSPYVVQFDALWHVFIVMR